MYKNSDFIEKEQPTLTEKNKKLISNYQKEPSIDNYLKLREEVIKNYNAVLNKKEQKLKELIIETNNKQNGKELVAEMQKIVQEMYITYWNRINSSMLRFTDSRLLKWNITEAYKYEYIPVISAGDTIYVKRTPVTNKEYAEFIKATKHSAPQNWINETYQTFENDYPVNYVPIKNENGNIIIYCNKIEEAIEYKIFEYNEETKLFKMFDIVNDTSYTVNNPLNTKYIVQALSYTAIFDKVNSDEINQVKNNNITTTDNNIKKEKNMHKN